MSLNLITNRTQADVDAILEAKAAVLAGTATPAQTTLMASSAKGMYNYTDLNRVGDAVQFIASMLTSIGVSVSVTGKNDWTVSDIPSLLQMTAYLNDIETIRGAANVALTTPASMNNLTYAKANLIEQILDSAYDIVNAISAQYYHSGITICGQGGIIA